MYLQYIVRWYVFLLVLSTVDVLYGNNKQEPERVRNIEHTLFTCAEPDSNSVTNVLTYKQQTHRLRMCSLSYTVWSTRTSSHLDIQYLDVLLLRDKEIKRSFVTKLLDPF